MFFTDLRHYDEYSMKSALGRPSDILPKLKERGATHYAVTNYCEISGWVNQYFECAKHKIIPILGVEMFVSDYKFADGEVEFRGSTGRDMKLSSWKKKETELDPFTSSLVAQNFNTCFYAASMKGYYNIIKCHNESQLNWMSNGNPRIYSSFLESHAEGVKCMLTFPYSDACALWFNGHKEWALERAEFYKRLFPDLVVEIPLQDEDNQVKVVEKAYAFALASGIKPVVTLGSHYQFKEDEKAYDTLLKLRNQRGNATFDIDTSHGNWYRSEEEVIDLWKSRFADVVPSDVFHKMLKDTNEWVSQFANLELDTSPKMPKFPDAENTLRSIALKGLESHGYANDKVYVERLEYELHNIIKAGFADYFLFLEDVCRWCREHGVRIGSGRGSGGGSLVLNCLYITYINPIKFNLLFERFLDASRLDEVVNKGGQVSVGDLPDVDIDFSDRDAVKGYLVEKYGRTKTCSIGTQGRLKTKSTLLSLGRIHGIDLKEIYEITQGDMKEFGASEEDADVEKLRMLAPSFDAFLKKYPHLEEEFAKLRGCINTYGQHAGGVLVSNIDLTDLLPVRLADGAVVSTWVEGLEDRELGKMGFVKMDILGVDAMNQIQSAIDLVKKHEDITLNMYELPLDDKMALKAATAKNFTGVFQFESPLAKRVVDAMGGVKCFDDLPALSALMRPAALQNKFHEKFGARRSGKEKWTVPECLADVLNPTYGLPLYQEAAYHVAFRLAGFDKVEAYNFMKLLYKGKMSKDKVPKWQEKFMKGCESKIKNGTITSDYALSIFNELLAFQGYGFNACLALDTIVETPEGFKLFADVEVGDMIKAPDKKGTDVFVPITVVSDSEEDVYEVTLADGKKVKSSMKHKYLCSDGVMRPLSQVLAEDWEVMAESE